MQFKLQDPLILDISQKPQPSGPSDDISPGDLYQTRQGKLYLVVAIQMWNLSEQAHYFSVNKDGEIYGIGRCGTSYIANNWTKIGFVNITFDQVEWL